jgi:NitT/TauT family transport system permease protein
MKLVRYPHHRLQQPLYETTLSRNLVSIAIALAVAVSAAVLLAHFAHPQNSFDVNRISVKVIAIGALNTFDRMALAFIVSLIFAVPLALLITSTPLVQRILLPIADNLQSLPVLAFFPVLAGYFVANHAYEFAAVFVIFLAMLWNIVFPVIGGLQTIPDDVNSAALVFKVRGWRRFWYITLPALFPFIVTGSLLAWAQGWTIVIVAEVLHTYFRNGNPSQDLLGLGSLLVDSNAQGKTAVFVAALVTMMLLVTLLNLLVWQPLLQLSRRFRFD